MDLPDEAAQEKLTIEEILELGDDSLGLKVVVNTKDTSLMGIISYVLPSSRRLTIEKVYDPKVGKLMGMRHFLFQEIVNVVVLGVNKKAREKLLEDVYQEDKRGKQLLMKKLVHPHMAEMDKSMHMDEDVLLGRTEHRPAKSKIDGSDTKMMPPPLPPPKVKRPEKWVIIDALDDAFKKAIDVIQGEYDVSLVLNGQKIGRFGTLAWLSIATSSIIFLFDMVKIGSVKAFKAGIEDILTDENLLKIVHDCRSMEDMLHHQFSINLKNVFDTQVAEVHLYMMNHKGAVPMYASGLPSLLIRYLKLSNQHVFFSRVREECTQNDESIWFERPLPESLCEGMARSVMYLRELRLILLKLMMVDLMQITNIYLGALRDKDSASVSNTELHVVPIEVQRLGHRLSNNTIDVHDPYITYSKDTFKILSSGK